MSDKLDKEISELLLKNAFEEYENARCDEIIEKYKDTEPEYSEEHKRRMEKLFKKEKHVSSWKKGLMRAAMIILAVFISGAMALQVEAVRIKIENWYYEITGEAIHIGNSIEELPGYSETDMPIYVLSDEFVEKYGLGVTQEISDEKIHTSYENINGNYVDFREFSGEVIFDLDSDNATIRKKKSGNKEILIINNQNEFMLYWKYDGNTIYVYTNFLEDSIDELIDNIVIKE